VLLASIWRMLPEPQPAWLLPSPATKQSCCWVSCWVDVLLQAACHQAERAALH
jgi:hypothetical protein